MFAGSLWSGVSENMLERLDSKFSDQPLESAHPEKVEVP